MQKLKYVAIGTALLLVPALAFAETLNATVTASTSAPTEKPPFPRLGPAIKETIETSRDAARNVASTTRDIVKDRVEAVHDLIDQHKADVRAMLERKRQGKMASTTEQIQAKREEMREKVEERREEVKDRIEGAREKAQQKFGEAVQRSVGNIVDRLKEAVERLTSIADRIDKRIDEREAGGADMSVSISLLSTARGDITAAQDKVTAVGTTLSTALSSTTPKGEVSKVRDAVKTAEDALKKAKESLQKTLESVRIEPTEASSTAQH